jgi:GcrA cell cycle regulator
MEDLDEKMIALWQKGLPASQICVELGITRNAVAGKLHRFKLSGRIDKKNIDERLMAISEQARKDKVARLPELTKQKPPEITLYKIEDKLIPLAKVNTEPVSNPVNFVFHKEAPAPVGKPISFEKLTPKSCRYVINSGDVKDFLFCGKPKERGSYCEGHAKLCYYTLVRKPRNEGEAQSS